MFIRLLLLGLFFIVNISLQAQFIHAPYRQFTLRDGLSQMQVISMFQDSRGYIWIGTKGGINRFNGEEITNFTTKDGLSNDYIVDIAEDSEGKIWMSTRNGLAYFDGHKITSFPSDKHSSIKIAPTPDGKVWYVMHNLNGNDNFGYLFDGEYISQIDLFPQLKCMQSPEIVYSKENDAIIVTCENCAFELKDGKMKELYCGNDRLVVLETVQNKILLAAMQDSLNFTLFEYQSGKLVEAARIENNKLSGETRLTEPVNFSIDRSDFPVIEVTPDSVLFKNIHGIQKNQFLIDHDNQLWIGSEEGFYLIHTPAFETFKKEYLPQVWSVNEDKKGNMWFTSFHFGLKMFDGKTIRSFPGLNNSIFSRDFYFHPAVDKKGRIIFPNARSLLAYDAGNFGKIKNSSSILTLFYEKEKDLLWAGGLKKVEIFDRDLQKIKTIGEPEGLEIKSFVVAIGKDSTGGFWFGSLSGLTRYNRETDKLVNYNRKNGRLQTEGIMSVFTDFREKTWFAGTNGLFWYNAEKDSVVKLENENLSETVSFVTAIDSSWLVVSQPYGIYLMDLPAYYKTGEMILHLFNEKNGFLGIEPGQDGAFTDSKGNIWMTTGTEVVKLNPKLLNLQNNLVRGRVTRVNGNGLLYNQKLVKLPKNEQSAVVTFDAICFNRPNEAEYSWKIEGNENDWSAWQKENYAVLSSLSDGITEIRLRVKVPGLPVSATTEDSIQLEVSLALWRQAWFFPALFGLFVFVALLTLLLLLRVSIKMADTKRQAKVFQVQAIQSQMNPHFIFNVLASFQTMILSTSVEKANDYLVKLAGLIRGFLDSSAATSEKNRENLISLQKEMEMLASFVGFQQLIYPGKFEYVVEIDPQIDIEKETIPPMLLQPFIENSIRHGLLLKKGKGNLRILILRIEKNGLHIQISDDGIGIEKAALTIKDSPFRYVSKGSALTLKRIELLNELGFPITLQTASSENGTIIDIKILNHEQ